MDPDAGRRLRTTPLHRSLWIALGGIVLAGCPSDAPPPYDAGPAPVPGTPDAGVQPAPGLPDANVGVLPDASVVPDASGTLPDAAVTPLDAASPDAGMPEDRPDLVGYDGPMDLWEAGLYRPGTQELAEGVQTVRPNFPLWSDGAEKSRYLWLPPGATVDTQDMDRWVFPVGTRAFKEFRAEDPTTGAQVRVETRLLEKRADGSWLQISFVWDAAQASVTPRPWGVPDALGTTHDVPSQEDCQSCHDGNHDVLLGIDAIQLSHPEGLAIISENPTQEATLGSLWNGGRLSHDPGTDMFVLPGDRDAQAALGMLHANCGSCHQPGTQAFERTDLELRLSIAELGNVEDTAAYRTSVGIENEKRFDEWPLRIAAGDATGSAMVGRMLSRDGQVAMPPLASELPDMEGAAQLSAWINGL